MFYLPLLFADTELRRAQQRILMGHKSSAEICWTLLPWHLHRCYQVSRSRLYKISFSGVADVIDLKECSFAHFAPNQHRKVTNSLIQTMSMGKDLRDHLGNRQAAVIFPSPISICLPSFVSSQTSCSHCFSARRTSDQETLLTRSTRLRVKNMIYMQVCRQRNSRYLRS